MYPVLLTTHSILRWLVVILGLLAIARALAGWLGRRDWQPADSRLGVLFASSMDLQLLVGLLLYFVFSPITTGALRNFGGAMSNAGVRFFLVEHSLLMLVAVVLAHIGRSASRRGEGPDRHRKAFIFFLLAFIALLVAIPWPFLPQGRPWFRF